MNTQSNIDMAHIGLIAALDDVFVSRSFVFDSKASFFQALDFIGGREYETEEQYVVVQGKVIVNVDLVFEGFERISLTWRTGVTSESLGDMDNDGNIGDHHFLDLYEAAGE